MASFKQPDNFIPGPHPAEAWTKWRKRFMIYFGAADLTTKGENQQRDILLHIMGEKGIEIYERLNWNEPDVGKVSAILDVISEHFKPYRNTTFKRHEFSTAIQTETATIDQFLSELTLKAKDCEFGDIEESLVRDRLICGLRDQSLRERLLRERDLPLATAIDMCRADEISKSQNKELRTPTYGDIHELKVGKSHRKITRKTSQFNHETSKDEYSCKRCMREHPPRRCPAFGKKCAKCNKKNHFAAACTSRGKRKHINTLEVGAANECEFEDFQLGALIDSTPAVSGKDWFEIIDLGKGKCRFKLDSGSQVNVLPAKVYNSLVNKPKLERSSEIITSYSNHPLTVLGSCVVECSTRKGKRGRFKFIVVDTDFTPILGLTACDKLNLIRRVHALAETPIKIDLCSEYKDVFQGLGRLPGLHHINVNENVTPRVYLPRRIPQALHEKVKLELGKMEKLGVIEKVEQPSEWVNPIVIVNKPKGGIRICIDPRALNEAIKREHLQLPTQESVLAQVGDAKIFTVIDASSAFYQVCLDEASTKLCTIATPFGRFKFRRMPFGIKSAPEVFQKYINGIMQDLPGVQCYFDDILISGSTRSEHDQRLKAVFERARKNNLKFDKTKLQLAQTEVKYIGHIISGKGIKILPSRIAAITGLKAPTEKKGLQRFLGMVNYLAKFIPHLAAQTEYLRQLLRRDTEWVWDEQAKEAFAKLKTLVSTAPVLRHFDPKEAITVSADASQYGMGAVLLQRGQPVAFASATLTPVQREYAQIEKELLALVFACERFHYFVYGREITIETDHRPLIAIMHKQYERLSPRIQRMVLRMQRYQSTVNYVPGKFQFVSDTLSRDPGNLCMDTEYLEGELHAVHSITSATPEKLTILRAATLNDINLKSVKTFIERGWPKKLDRDTAELMQFRKCKEELHMEEGLCYRGDRLVIPKSERGNVLFKLHESHLGVIACKSRAREAVYWPGMTKDIEEYVTSCQVCQKHSKANQKEPLLQHEVVTKPWEKLGIDFLKVENREFILAVDYHSKYVELQQLTKTDAPPVITFVKSICARHGIPKTIMSDNGPPFDSKVFREFARDWGFMHVTSSPKYAKSNGMVERTIQTIKNRIRKTLQDGQDISMALLNYRATPHNGLGSPGELLMGRKLRTKLPISESMLNPNFSTTKTVKILEKIQQTQKKYADKGSKPLCPLKEGERVLYAQTPGEWKLGTVDSRSETPRSYNILSGNGHIFRRNRLHVKQLKEPDEQQNGQINSAPLNVTQTPEPGDTQVSKPTEKNVKQESTETKTPNEPEKSPQRCTRSGRLIRAPQRYKE